MRVLGRGEPSRCCPHPSHSPLEQRHDLRGSVLTTVSQKVCHTINSHNILRLFVRVVWVAGKWNLPDSVAPCQEASTWERTLPLGRGTSHNQRGTKSAKGRWRTDLEINGCVPVKRLQLCCDVLAVYKKGNPHPHPTPTPPLQPAEKLPRVLLIRTRDRLLQFLVLWASDIPYDGCCVSLDVGRLP